MVNGEVILRKLEKLREYISELRAAQDITLDKYKKNNRDRAFIERYIHISIETVFDVANHIISYQGWKEPETYRESIQILVSHGILPDEKMSDFQNMASFRNILVHHYEKIEDEVVFGIFQNKLEDFDLFGKYILEYLKKDKS
jgi:uncharacterized protein YutE (UPF0331/DUF86 family)